MTAQHLLECLCKTEDGNSLMVRIVMRLIVGRQYSNDLSLETDIAEYVKMNPEQFEITGPT